MKHTRDRVIIVANGNLEKNSLRVIHRGDFVIGVDRAAYWLLKNGITPDMAVGDFDSCTAKEFQTIKKNIPDIHTFSAEKDFTDTELALEQALKNNPEEIIIIGGLGSRFDHSLGAVFLLERCLRDGVPASVIDEGNIVTLQGRGRTILEKREGHRYLSVIPVTDAITISLEGLKYPLNHHVLVRGQTIGISNEITGKQAVITLHNGRALIIQSSD